MSRDTIGITKKLESFSLHMRISQTLLDNGWIVEMRQRNKAICCIRQIPGTRAGSGTVKVDESIRLAAHIDHVIGSDIVVADNLVAAHIGIDHLPTSVRRRDK